MITKETHLEECSVCGGQVPRGPGYYNGTVKYGRLICEGCVLAIGLSADRSDDEDGARKVESYCEGKGVTAPVWIKHNRGTPQ